MHPLVYVMLVAGSAHVQRTYGSSADDFYQGLETVEGNLIMANDVWIEAVNCPVCNDEYTRTALEFECKIVIENQRYKQCRNGVYKNPMCGGRLDCFRHAGETCTSGRIVDRFGWYCAPGYSCNVTAGVCVGTGEVPTTTPRPRHYNIAIGDNDWGHNLL